MATSTPTYYDTPVGVGGAINTNTGMITSGSLAGTTAQSYSTTPINSTSLSPTAPLTLPPAPTPTNYNPTVANGNAVISANTTSLTPPAPTGTETPTDNLSSLFDKYLTSQPTPPSATDIYATDYKNANIDNYASDLNTKNAAVKSAQSKLKGITAQIDGLNAEAAAAQLKTEDRQAPTFAIAGEQGAIDRARAIKAIPLQVQALAAQAEVASAQGDAELAQGILKQAETHLDTLYGLHMADATAQYNYKKDVLDKVYQFATAREKDKIDELHRKDDQAFQLKRDDLANTRDMQKMQLQAQLTRQNALYSHNLTAGDSLKTLSGKPQTATQAQVNGYADRMAAAAKTIANVGSKFTGLTSYLGQKLPNFAKSGERQRYEQAQLNFLNAVLRQESGAAIGTSEYKKYSQQYFPQPGDKPAAVQQKLANINDAINNFYRQANVQRPVSAGDIIESGGQQYQVGDDGVTLMPL